MCGRYAIECEEENIFLKEILETINRKYADQPILSRMKTGEIFPTETVPVLALEGGKTFPFLMNWGFPRTDRTVSTGGVTINARAETAMEKNMFRASLLSRRCVVPSTGFYEWKQEEPGVKKKNKYLLRPPGAPMMYMAGIYNLFPTKDGPMPCFVIITTAANSWVAPIHNRMPLILDSGSCKQWLHGGSAAMEILLRPCEARLETVLQATF